MFRLLRYFSNSSAIAITVVTVVLLLLYHQNAINDLLRFGEAQNDALTRSLANSVWPKYSSYVATTSGMNIVSLRANPRTKDIWELLFKTLADDPDFEYLIIDSTVVRAHQHAAGAKGGPKIKPSDVRAAA